MHNCGVCRCGGRDALTFKCQSTKVKPLEQFRSPHCKNLIDHMSHSSGLDTDLFHGPHIFGYISYSNAEQAPHKISIFRVETSILGEPPNFQSLSFSFFNVMSQPKWLI